MSHKDSISSRETDLRYGIEPSPGATPAELKSIAPRSYGGFGRENQLTHPEPILSDRMDRKPAVTSFRVNAGFQVELTAAAVIDLFRALLFALVRAKTELTGVADVDGTANEFSPASGGDGYFAGDLIFSQGADDDQNNGLFLVDAAPAAGSVPVAGNLIDANGQDITLRRVGFEFDAGDLSIDEDGDLVSATKDFTELGIMPGEPLFIGGDAAATRFDTAAANTTVRADVVEANRIKVSKPHFDDAYLEANPGASKLPEDDGAGKTVRLFVASRGLKNEANPEDVVKTLLQFERRMGAPDADAPADVQYEYAERCVASQATINSPEADLVTADFQFVGGGFTRRDAGEGPKAATRPDPELVEPYNTAYNVLRARLGEHDAGALVDVISALSITVNNNVTVLDGVGRPSFATNEGRFEVTGDLTAFFQDFALAKSIEGNRTGTFDIHWWRGNAGLSLDIPAMSMSGGQPNVVADQAITVPVSFRAYNGRHANPNLAHALMMSWWDYLPDRAMPNPAE